MLQLAREHLLIFVDEHVNQKLSKSLDLKNKGLENTNRKNAPRRDRGNQGPDTRYAEAEREGLLGQVTQHSMDERGTSTSIVGSQNTGVKPGQQAVNG